VAVAVDFRDSVAIDHSFYALRHFHGVRVPEVRSYSVRNLVATAYSESNSVAIAVNAEPFDVDRGHNTTLWVHRNIAIVAVVDLDALHHDVVAVHLVAVHMADDAVIFAVDSDREDMEHTVNCHIVRAEDVLDVVVVDHRDGADLDIDRVVLVEDVHPEDVVVDTTIPDLAAVLEVPAVVEVAADVVPEVAVPPDSVEIDFLVPDPEVDPVLVAAAVVVVVAVVLVLDPEATD